MYYQAQNQFGLTFDQVRKLYPSKSFPASGQIDTPEVNSYAPAPTPQYNPATHAVREAAPVGGVQQWEVYPLPAEEVEANQAAAAQALQQSIVDATQQRLDAFARTRNYPAYPRLEATPEMAAARRSTAGSPQAHGSS